MSNILTPDMLGNPAALQNRVAQQQLMNMRMDDMHIRASSMIMAALVGAVVPKAMETGDQPDYDWLAQDAVRAATALLGAYGIATKPLKSVKEPAQPTRTMHDPLEAEPAEGEPDDRYTNQG